VSRLKFRVVMPSIEWQRGSRESFNRGHGGTRASGTKNRGMVGFDKKPADSFTGCLPNVMEATIRYHKRAVQVGALVAQ
jgi:hypothetical protein